MEKKSKKKPIILVVSLLVLTVIGVFVVYGQMYTKKANEMWDFRETALDEEFFPMREEVVACVYGTDEELSKYKCSPDSLTERIDGIKSSISNYEVSYEDTQALKEETLNGLDIMNNAVEIATDIGELSGDDPALMELGDKFLSKRDELAENTKDINEIVNEYYN